MRRCARGFTLIELMLVITIIGILMAFLIPKGIGVLQRTKVMACRGNMKNLYEEGYMVYYDKKGYFPPASGVRNFLNFWETWEHTDENAKRLTCPAAGPSFTPGLLDERGEVRPPEQWFDDLDNVDGTYTAYAGRDMKNHPLHDRSGLEALVADDNELEIPNHKGGETVVLMSDGTVKEIDLAEMKKRGVVDREATKLDVGENSPVEALRKLIPD